jgi:hypothetical protein
LRDPESFEDRTARCRLERLVARESTRRNQTFPDDKRFVTGGRSSSKRRLFRSDDVLAGMACHPQRLTARLVQQVLQQAATPLFAVAIFFIGSELLTF